MGKAHIGCNSTAGWDALLGTLHKLHHRSTAFGEQTGKDTRKVASPGADQGPLLLQKGKEMRQQVLTPDKGVEDGVNLTAKHLQQGRPRRKRMMVSRNKEECNGLCHYEAALKMFTLGYRFEAQLNESAHTWLMPNTNEGVRNMLWQDMPR